MSVSLNIETLQGGEWCNAGKVSINLNKRYWIYSQSKFHLLYFHELLALSGSSIVRACTFQCICYMKGHPSHSFNWTGSKKWEYHKPAERIQTEKSRSVVCFFVIKLKQFDLFGFLVGYQSSQRSFLIITWIFRGVGLCENRSCPFLYSTTFWSLSFADKNSNY